MNAKKDKMNICMYNKTNVGKNKLQKFFLFFLLFASLPHQQRPSVPSNNINACHRISVTQLNSQTIYTQFYYIQRKMRNILTPVTMFFQHVSLSSSNTMACDIIFFTLSFIYLIFFHHISI